RGSEGVPGGFGRTRHGVWLLWVDRGQQVLFQDLELELLPVDLALVVGRADGQRVERLERNARAVRISHTVSPSVWNGVTVTPGARRCERRVSTTSVSMRPTWRHPCASTRRCSGWSGSPALTSPSTWSGFALGGLQYPSS